MKKILLVSIMMVGSLVADIAEVHDGETDYKKDKVQEHKELLKGDIVADVPLMIYFDKNTKELLESDSVTNEYSDIKDPKDGLEVGVEIADYANIAEIQMAKISDNEKYVVAGPDNELVGWEYS